MEPINYYREISIHNFPECCGLCKNFSLDKLDILCAIDSKLIRVNGKCDKWELASIYE